MIPRWFGVFGFVAVALVATPVSAQGLDVVIRDGFGTEGSSLILVDVVNRSSRQVNGIVELAVDENAGGDRFRMGADIPPRDRRTFQFETGTPTGFLKARLTERGRVLGTNEAYRGSNANSIIVLADPPRLQTSIAGITGSRDMTYGPEAFDYATGTIDFDAAGDPVAPRRVEGWRGVDLLVATAAELERLDSAQLEALRQHVWAGGRVLISPSAPEDVRTASVRRLAGDIHFVAGLVVSQEPLWQAEYFGGGRPLGFGYVFVASRDINAPGEASSTRVTALLASIAGRTPTIRPRLPLFGGESTNQWESRAQFRDLRTALDPNASFRPALGLVAVLLLLYVLAVGPLNFRYVQKRGKPTLALITTPVLSFGCLVLMLLVGFVGKGVKMRYRSVTWVDSVQGETDALRRSYLGLYATRPATFDVEARGLVGFAGNTNTMLNHEFGPTGEATLTDIRSSLWSTTLLREEEVIPFGGVDFSVVDGELRTVTNLGDSVLESALIVGTGGRVFEVGDLAPGVSAPISSTPSFFVSVGEERSLASALGFPEDERDIVVGQLRMVGVAGGGAPAFYARVEQSEGTISLFAEETSSTIVSVQVAAQELPISGDANAWAPTSFEELVMQEDGAEASP